MEPDASDGVRTREEIISRLDHSGTDAMTILYGPPPAGLALGEF